MAKKANDWTHPTVPSTRDAKIGSGTKIWQHSTVMAGATIGPACVIGHNCLICGGAKLGQGVKIQSNTDVWDLVTLENDVFVGPSAVFTNDLSPRACYPKAKFPQYGKWLPTLVKTGATIGANATIVCGHTIGSWALIGAGAVVTRDVPDHGLVAGVPAKLIGWVCECGNKLSFTKNNARCKVCLRKYQKIGDKVEKIK